jgi:hypothetical protein
MHVVVVEQFKQLGMQGEQRSKPFTKYPGEQLAQEVDVVQLRQFVILHAF